MSGSSRLIALTAILAIIHSGEGRAAELSEAPLLVVVETGPGAGCDAAAVRGAIAAELKARVAAPTSPPVVALSAQRSDVLLVAVDRDRIVVTLRGRADRELTRSIAAPADRASKLRAVAWLAGNVARDQLQTLALPDAVPAGQSPPPAAPDDAPLPPVARVATEPPPVADLGGITPAASLARSQPLVRQATPPRWTLGFGVGTAMVFQGPTVATAPDVGWGLAAQFEAQRRLRGPFFVGAALDGGPQPVHGVGVAAIGGIEHRSGPLFVAGSLGLGFQTFSTTQVWMASATPPDVSETFTVVDTRLVGYARATIAAGAELAPALDLVLQLSGHLAAVERRDAGFALTTLGARFKIR